MSSSIALLMGSAGFAFGRRIKSVLSGAKYVDKYWDNVTLLLTGDELADSSVYDRKLTVNNTFIDFSIKKFGTGSLSISPSNGIAISSTSDLLGDDYTVEFWFKANATTDPYATLFKIETISGFGLACTRSGVYGSQFGDVVTNTDVSGYSIFGYGSNELQAAFDDLKWHYIAISKSGQELYLFIDGLIVGETLKGITSFSVTSIQIGNGFPTGFSGYIDDFRVTKNAARYTTNFPVPAYALPYVSKGPPFGRFMLDGATLLGFEQNANMFLFMGY